jgi:hypothetical protein
MNYKPRSRLLNRAVLPQKQWLFVNDLIREAL